MRADLQMGSSRAAGASLLSLISSFQSLGPAEALRPFNLSALAGRPAADVFVAILDSICPAGGSVDEAIARQAMLETIGDMAEAGIGSFDTLTPSQWTDFFIDFIVRSIEGRVIADLGARGITLPDDVVAIEHAQTQLHDFVAGCARGEVLRLLNDLAETRDRDIQRTVDRIYEAAFDIVAAAGEATQ